MTSERSAILLVKKITAIKTKRGYSKPQIQGMKPIQYCRINWEVLSPLFTKSSVFSLLSTATAITVKSSMQKINVVKNFLRIYQSIFLIIAPNVENEKQMQAIAS